MNDMARRSLENSKGRNVSRRAKPMVLKGGATRKRTPYKCGGKRSHHEEINNINKSNSNFISNISLS